MTSWKKKKKKTESTGKVRSAYDQDEDAVLPFQFVLPCYSLTFTACVNCRRLVRENSPAL